MKYMKPMYSTSGILLFSVAANSPKLLLKWHTSPSVLHAIACEVDIDWQSIVNHNTSHSVKQVIVTEH